MTTKPQLEQRVRELEAQLDAMTARAERAELNERLTTIRSNQRLLTDSLQWVSEQEPLIQLRFRDWTQARIAEINQLEYEAKTIEAQLKTVEQS